MDTLNAVLYTASYGNPASEDVEDEIPHLAVVMLADELLNRRFPVTSQSPAESVREAIFVAVLVVDTVTDENVLERYSPTTPAVALDTSVIPFATVVIDPSAKPSKVTSTVTAPVTAIFR